jgi:hypothetical protein
LPPTVTSTTAIAAIVVITNSIGAYLAAPLKSPLRFGVVVDLVAALAVANKVFLVVLVHTLERL